MSNFCTQKFVVSRGEAFGRTPQSAKHFIRESAFAGEFFNPKLGLKKRGLLQEKSPLDRQMTRTCQK
ncbi:hypothetical protein, partial [Negativibacillus massiliensis]|uniref:hypothetical protein n=1 Tax=Negativibacillus massiliensis TaxID=1871035 RepID=UPI003AF5E855